MPVIPLGTGAYKRSDGFVPEVTLRNMYLEKDESGISPDNTLRITRPGLRPLYQLGGAVRGIDYRVGTGETLAVAGDMLHNAERVVGTIGGLGVTPMVSTTFHEAIVGDKLYLYDTAVIPLDTPVDPFTDAPQTAQDVDQLNQYILVLMTNGRWYWIVPGEAQYETTQFATAESSADGGVAICRVGDEFWIFGTKTIEPWQATGDQDAPFQRASGRLYERGCLSRDTVRRFDNSVMWVADDYTVCRGGAVPQVVSNNGLSERIRKATAATSAWTFALDGHEFYVLRIPGEGTFAYDAQTQNWCEFSTLGRKEWAPHVGTEANGVTMVGDSDTGAVWTIEPLADDAGTAIEWVASATVPLTGKTPRNDSISIGVGTPENAKVRVRWKDGQDDYPTVYEELLAVAPFDVCNLYRLGQPLQPYRTVEFSGLTRVRIAGAMANEGWR